MGRRGTTTKGGPVIATAELSIRAGDLNMRRQFVIEVDEEADALLIFDNAKNAVQELVDERKAEDPAGDA